MSIFMGGHTMWLSKLGPSSEPGCPGIKSMTVQVWTHTLPNMFAWDSRVVLVIFHPYSCFWFFFCNWFGIFQVVKTKKREFIFLPTPNGRFRHLMVGIFQVVKTKQREFIFFPTPNGAESL